MKPTFRLSPYWLGAFSLAALLFSGAWFSMQTEAADKPRVRQAPRVPVLSAKAPRPRNVLLVLTESVRFDSVCIEYDQSCKLTPFTNRLLPSRVPLLEVRSSASTTAISVGVLWTGLLPTQMTEAIRSAPTLFDFARAGGADTAYFTSQAAMFTGSSAFLGALPLSRRCQGSDLDDVPDDAGADDRLLTERVKRDLPRMREPWFAVVQYANTHYPYRVRDEEPFQPASEDKGAESTSRFKNHYQNAVYAQDRTIADLLGSLRASPVGARTVVIYTSDHGEAFREHGQLGHTTSVFDEEIHVPTWIDAPEDTLLAREREALASATRALAYHVDVAPTVIDLLGLAEAPYVVAASKRWLGTSLLRKARTDAVLPITNCTEIWGCSFRNWGVMHGSWKLESREFDADWHCFNLAADPREEHDLGARACAGLTTAAQGFFGKLPRLAGEMRGLGL